MLAMGAPLLVLPLLMLAPGSGLPTEAERAPGFAENESARVHPARKSDSIAG
jgi:hypothetical protein